jgi:uncharacterized protein (TIGR02466 family)
MGRFVHIFPLSIFRDQLELSDDYRRQVVERILEMEGAAQQSKPTAHSAWLGDTQGHEFLFQKKEFGEMFHQIAAKIREYANALGLDTDLIDFYFQRSWATITRRGEWINEHAHEQSNISFAYYLQKPDASGGISFITYNHPNEMSRGIFTPAKANLGFIKQPSMLTWNTVSMDPAEGEIVIFPSKTLHATSASQSDQPRISISADVSMLLRNSRGHETMMPHFSHWRSFDEWA